MTNIKPNIDERKIVLSDGLRDAQMLVVFILSLFVVFNIVYSILTQNFIRCLYVVLFGGSLFAYLIYWYAKRFFDVEIDGKFIYFGNLFFKRRAISTKEFIKIIPLDETILAASSSSYSMILQSNKKIWFNYKGRFFKNRNIKAEELNECIKNLIDKS